MSSIVFILGAGASRQSGGPLMGDFLDIATNILRAGQAEDKGEDFERVFRVIGCLQSVHSKAQLDLTNIESIFTALELGNVIQRVPGLEREEIPKVINSLKALIVRTLEVRIPFPHRAGQIYAPAEYSTFAKLLKHLTHDAWPKQTASVITFNYDVGIDLAMAREGLGPDYVIGKPELRSQTPQMQLMKLHGSLNWGLDPASKTIHPLHLSDYVREYQARHAEEGGRIEARIAQHLIPFFKTHRKVDIAPEPVIVPPTWNKADYHHALSDVWAAAAKHLSEAEHIFVLGYSLPSTDSFFRHLYALGSVGKSPLHRFVVFDPDVSGSVDERFRALLGIAALARYRYESKPFTHGADAIKEMFPGRK